MIGTYLGTSLALKLVAAPKIPDDIGGTSDRNSCLAKNGTFCTDWFDSNSTLFEDALSKHIKLTLVSMVVGFLISFTLALIAYRFRWIALPVTFLSSVLYTIPAIATFYILVGITGLKDLTAEIALVSYTLLILFTNTLAGLTGVSPDVRDAAQGLGMTARQSLLRVELPLAIPTIVAGIRVATVTIISLVTVAGLIGLGGLGDIIYTQGVKNNTNTALIVGGVACIALALLADAILVIAQRLVTPWARARRNR
ncbi:MAG: ABC transporter permease [Gordonia polyisoprenivorans]|nr:ABC transporter permease [Gordonia polyisoprenivorans]